MRVGVIGCGYWGSKHIRVLGDTPGVDNVVAIDPCEERRRVLQRSFPVLKTFADVTSALDAVDAVVVATPPSLHASVALLALEAGKHVLVEKPMTTTVASARDLIDVAKARSCRLFVGHTFLYNPAVWMLRDIVASGDLGRIDCIDTARLNLGMYQHDVNVVWDLAPHDISIINWLLGATPSMVELWASSSAHSDLEDVAYLRLHYADYNILTHIHLSWLDPCKVRRVTVVGSAKMAVYNDLADQERIRVFDKGVVAGSRSGDMHAVPMSYRYGGIWSPYVAFREPLAIQDERFVKCCLSGEESPTDGADGLAVVQTLEAAELSLRYGVPVAIEDVGTSTVGSRPVRRLTLRDLAREGA